MTTLSAEGINVSHEAEIFENLRMESNGMSWVGRFCLYDERTKRLIIFASLFSEEGAYSDGDLGFLCEFERLASPTPSEIIRDVWRRMVRNSKKEAVLEVFPKGNEWDSIFSGDQFILSEIETIRLARAIARELEAECLGYEET